MQTMSWKCFALVTIALSSLALAVPVPQESPESFDVPNPVAADVSNQCIDLFF